jgi:hypothetical protein
MWSCARATGSEWVSRNAAVSSLRSIRWSTGVRGCDTS